MSIQFSIIYIDKYERNIEIERVFINVCVCFVYVKIYTRTHGQMDTSRSDVRLYRGNGSLGPFNSNHSLNKNKVCKPTPL